MVMETHGSKMYISTGLFVLFAFLGLFTGYIVFFIQRYCRNKAKMDGKRNRNFGRAEDDYLIDMTESEPSVEANAGQPEKKRKWAQRREEKVKKDVEANAGQPGKKRKWAQRREEKVDMTESESNAEANADQRGKKRKWAQRREESRRKEKVKKEKVTWLELSFRTRGEDAAEYAQKVADSLLGMRAFKTKLAEHEVNKIRDDKVEALFVLKHTGDDQPMADTTIMNVVQMLQDDKRCKKINLHEVEHS